MDLIAPLLIAEKISKKHGKLQVLQDVDLQVAKGEIVVILGASGAGKSTLLNLLATLDRPDTGSLFIDGLDPLSLGSNALAQFRNRHIGFIFQFHNLLPEFTSLENTCLPAYIGNLLPKKEIDARARELLILLGLGERLHHKPDALSGGEQQRVAVARALINNPKIIFADEPSGSLDTRNATRLHELFFDLRLQLNQTFVLATHNQALAAIADRRLLIQDGRLITEAE